MENLIELKETLERFEKSIVRYENIRQIYLEEEMDVDWVNNRINNFIKTDIDKLYQYIRMIEMDYTKRNKKNNFV